MTQNLKPCFVTVNEVVKCTWRYKHCIDSRLPLQCDGRPARYLCPTRTNPRIQKDMNDLYGDHLKTTWDMHRTLTHTRVHPSSGIIHLLFIIYYCLVNYLLHPWIAIIQHVQREMKETKRVTENERRILWQTHQNDFYQPSCFLVIILFIFIEVVLPVHARYLQ
jgi:hypothetical protein